MTRQPRDGGAIWAPTDRRRQLTRDAVVLRALDVLEAEGLDGLTMRRLAAALGVKAASLYNHVVDKEELLALMGDAMCAGIPNVSPSRPWRRELEAAAANFRAALMGHRDGGRVIASTSPAGPNRLRLIEQILATIRRAGFMPATAADLAFILNSYVVGFVLDETASAPTDPTAAASQRELARKRFKTLPRDEYPTIVELADQLVDSPAERRFRTGLRALLDGFEARRM
jgi:TetR/AcrR family tetracycline transcriptional repressor